MTIQQLRYADAVAACGSFSKAARKVFVSQPALTESIRLLEEELHVDIFARTHAGVSVTREGEEFLSAARQILDDVARIVGKYDGKRLKHPQFSVSCQHFAFAVDAFMEVVKDRGDDEYDLTIRETVTSEIIEDVARMRSEVGILYLSNRNEQALNRIFRNEGLEFEELYRSTPHVFVSRRHPLAKRKSIAPAELDDYPYISYEQGLENALYFSEEVLPAIDRKKNIRVRDRATMTKLVLGMAGYTISSGIMPKAYAKEVVAVPLELDENIRIGVVRRAEFSLSPAAERFLAAVRRRIPRKQSR